MTREHETMPEPTATGRVVQIWSLVRRHLFLIVFMSAVGTGLGYLYFLKTPPVFQSTCSLFMRNESNGEGIPFQMTEGTTHKLEQPHALLIATPIVAERALTKDMGGGDEDDDRPHRMLGDLPCFANSENPVQHLLSRLTARSGTQSGAERPDIVNLTYRDRDPLTSKAVLDAIVQSYQDFLGSNHKTGSDQVYDLIVNAQKSLLANLAEVDANYNEFRQETPLLFNSQHNGEIKVTNLHTERMAEIEAARQKITIYLTERKAELQSITEALAQGASREALTIMIQQIIMKGDARAAEAGVKTVATEIFPLLLEEQLMLQNLGAEHPKVQQLQKKIALTQDFWLNELPEEERAANRRKRGDFLTLCMDALRHEIQGVEAKVVELDQLFEAERHSAKSILAYEVRNEGYRKDMIRLELLYNSVCKRLDELNLLKDYGGYKTSIISPPQMGAYVAPVFTTALLCGGLFGAAVGIGLGYLVEASDKTYRSPEEVSEHLGLPIVGHIPVIQREQKLSQTNSRLDRTLVTYYKPKSRMSESYRAIRTSLYFSTRGDKHKVIQITSPNPGDGKTTLCANLAISIAQSGKKVLLIDADFRRPRIHELFHLDKTIGMSSVIGGEAELPDAIQCTDVENLWCLPCGSRPNNPCELLTSRRFEELLNIIKEQYDFVIVDTPPLLAVTDPSAVAARVDGVLLTIRLSKRSRGEAARATEILSTVGGNTLGVVVNGVGAGARYGYGYGYGYGRYQGYGGYGGYEYRYSSRSGAQDDNPYYADDDNDSDHTKEGVVPPTKSRLRGSRRDA